MSQYFENDFLVASNKREISYEIYGHKITLITDNGVFSKKQVDEGSFAFLKVIVPLMLEGNILDLGCGYGPIGLTIAITSPKARVTLADINTRALALCDENARRLGLSSRVTCVESNIYENLKGTYDAILINPPIRAGKKVTYQMYEGALSHLVSGGKLYIVIRRNQGALTASKYIEDLFGNVTLLKKDKGYYMYEAKKPE